MRFDIRHSRLGILLALLVVAAPAALAQEQSQPRKYRSVTTTELRVDQLVADEIIGSPGSTIVCSGDCTLAPRFEAVNLLHAYVAEYAPNRKDVVERVNRQCPGLILRDHEFTDAVATVLWLEDNRWGRNGKRGNENDPSHDAIAYKTSASPFGVAVIDIIGAAGRFDASPAWIDQTDETIRQNTTGVWVAPSGRPPACLTGGTDAPDEQTIPVDPTIPIDYRPVLMELLAIAQRNEARLTGLEQRDMSQPIDFAALDAYIDDMVGEGPADDPDTSPNHVTDIKERIDKLRAELAQLTSWLRSRRALGF